MFLIEPKRMGKQEPNPGEGAAPAKFPIFKDLSKSEVEKIFDAGVVRALESGKLLFRKGEIGREMYIILKGKIHIVDEYGTYRKVIVKLGPGEFFGEMAMFENSHTRSTHALVKEPSQVLVLSEEILDKLIDRKMPKRFLRNIIGVLCRRLRANNGMYMRAKSEDKMTKDVKWLG